MTRFCSSDVDSAFPSDAAHVRPDSPNDVVVTPFFVALGELRGDPSLVTALQERHAALQGPGTPDETGATAVNATVAVALVAADQALAPVVPDRAERHRLLEQAFVEPFAATAQQATESVLDAADDPFTVMVQTARIREEHAFGPRFVFDHPVDDDQEFVSEVRHCFFHEVLTGYSAADLTTILCAFDATWMSAIDPTRHGFTVDRGTTIATGGSSCPFRFRRTEPMPGLSG